MREWCRLPPHFANKLLIWLMDAIVYVFKRLKKKYPLGIIGVGLSSVSHITNCHN